MKEKSMLEQIMEEANRNPILTEEDLKNVMTQEDIDRTVDEFTAFCLWFESHFERGINPTKEQEEEKVKEIENWSDEQLKAYIAKLYDKSRSEDYDSLIKPFQTKYLFHTQNLRGTASIAIFDLKKLHKLTSKNAVLKGRVTLNNEPLRGSIIIDFEKDLVQYNYKGKYPHYTLTIDPSVRDLWNELVLILKANKNL